MVELAKFAVESLRAADAPCERSPCADSDEVARVQWMMSPGIPESR
jgi:hypothetical protein